MTDNNVVSLTPRPGGAGESATAKQERQRHERFLAKQAEKTKLAAKAQVVRERIQDHNERAGRGLPRIHLDTDPDAIRTLATAVDNNVLPDTYVRAGAVVCVETPSGAIVTHDAPPQAISTVDQKRLTRLLAEHTFTYSTRSQKLPDGDSELVEVEVTPKDSITGPVLKSTSWPNLRPLIDIVTAPVFRPDGSLMQEPGYDPVTALIYAPKLPLPAVPEHPTTDELRIARSFLLGELLHDFPWVGPSLANYIAMLVAPLLRTYLGGVLVPMGAIDAASPSTGKTLLTQIMTSVYSGYTRAWVSDDTELRKVITSILIDQGGAVVVLDNVPKGELVDQAALSSLLTNRVWSDRTLGVSLSIKAPNDRVWLVTGNALAISGDNASRSVPIRLDANMPDPDLRPSSKFALGDLERWLQVAANRATLLHHLLVLVRGWIVAGAKRIETPMRTFGTWADATAGFLDWLAVPGFMTNRHWLEEADEEEGSYGAFYSRWYELFGNRQLRVAELRNSVMPDQAGTTQHDWKDVFLVRKRDGQIPSAGGLSKMLSSERGNFRGGYRLDAEYDNHSKVWLYSVTPTPKAEAAS